MSVRLFKIKIAWKISSEDKCWAYLSQRGPNAWSDRGQEEMEDETSLGG